jgi:deleted-in-malignant-brain-tumors protein 1
MSPDLQQAMLFIAVLSLFTAAYAQSNQGVRLADSPLGSHAGRVEVKYNGRWGTVCDDGWSSFDARVVCNMLNFTSYVCAVSSATTVFGQGTGPVWLTNLRCSFYDTHLDQCDVVPQNINPCQHYEDAALICQDNTIMPVPINITQTNQTTRTITVSWTLPFIPAYIQEIDFRLNVTQENSYYGTRIIHYYTVVTTSTEFNYTITGLTINQTYTLSISAEGEYQWCSYNGLVGNYSEPITITTAERVPPSTLPIRLLPVSPDTPHIGRLEVFHDGDWGTVCDDYFGYDDANLACKELNYTAGAICYANSVFPPSRGPIWLDNVDCSSADRFEDCTHNGWGVHDCGVSENIGLVCNPGPSGVPEVTGLTVTAVSHTSITVQWDAVLSSGRYRIQYVTYGNRSYSTSVTHPTSEYTLRYLTLGWNYTISVAAGYTFNQYRGGNCYYQYLYGEYSESVVAETRETAPTVAVSNLHITTLNSTSVEAVWRLPYVSTGINGIVRGFKIIVDKINGTQQIINVEDGDAQAYIITDLEQSATYLFSIVIYTVGDGPQSVILQVTMPDSDFAPLISKFGVYGNGIEVVTASIYQLGFNVLCGSNVKDMTFVWKLANGSHIGISNPGFRQGRFANGTAVLQIGTALPYIRRLVTCDGGVYTCVATSAGGDVITRNFTLLIGTSPQAVDPPIVNSKGSTWIQISWPALDCDGGFEIASYNVEYKSSYIYSYYYTLAASVTQLNYTIHDLTPSTGYNVRVSTVSYASTRTTPSLYITVTTLEQGPSPPRGVEVTVSYNSEVCATWRPPATPVGEVILYKLYGELVDSSADIVDAIDLPTGTLVKTFPGSQSSGCMQVSPTGLIYHFQMSAVSAVNGIQIEGMLSSLSAMSTVYVPNPGIPQIVNLQGFATNTSVTLQWELPDNVQLSKSYFNVSYSGMVEWTSAAGVFTSFQELGQKTIDNTSLTISPLTPSTKYVFQVAMVTQEGQGAEVRTVVTTEEEVGDKLAYFQIRILGISDCEEWQNDDTEQKLSGIRKFLATVLNTQCKCNLTMSHISQGEFSCRAGPADSVTFRARISGTSSRSASDMASLIRTWVQDGDASIKVGASRLQLDPTCDVSLDNLHAPDCVEKLTEKPAITSSIKTPTEKPTQKGTTGKTGNKSNGGSGGSSSADTVGILLGGIFAGLMLALLIVMVIIIVIWMKRIKSQSFKDQSVFRGFVNEPSAGESVAMDEQTEKL